MSNNEKLKALKLTIDKIDKDFGKGSVMMMNEKGDQVHGSCINRFNWVGRRPRDRRFAKGKDR